MHMNAVSPPPRRATNVSLDHDYVTEAMALGINISQACERGLIKAVKEARAAQWQEDNRAAMDGWNAWVSENGLPLAAKRMF